MSFIDARKLFECIIVMKISIVFFIEEYYYDIKNTCTIVHITGCPHSSRAKIQGLFKARICFF